MEKAIIINQPKDLGYWKPEYNRIYLGSDLCSRLIPNGKELKEIIAFVKKNKIELTLLTPQIGIEGLNLIKKVAKILKKEKLLGEVVVNDYGLFYYFLKNFPETKTILGRLISIFNVPFYKSFAYSRGIKRIEIDNKHLLEGIGAKYVSYYYPYSVFSVTRYCPLVDLSSKKENPGILDCSQECLEIGELEINSHLLSEPAILRGNAQFIKNGINLKELVLKGVDRLVFEPSSKE